jgi:hypothetical protein
MAAKAHLLLDSETQILDEMKAIRHLSRLRRALTCSLRVEPASVSAHDVNRGMPLQPLCNACHASVFEKIHDLSTLKIDNAPPAAQLKPYRHCITLDRQILKTAVGPAVPISALMSAIRAYARGWPASRHDPFAFIAGYDALHFNARAGRPFRFRSHASPYRRHC